MRYIYEKYNVTFGSWSGESISSSTGGMGGSEVYGYSSEPVWNGSEYVGSGWGAKGKGSSIWYTGGGGTYATSASKSYGSWSGYVEGEGIYRYNFTNYTRTRSATVTTLVGKVTAEDKTYPDNGLHHDGYWYIKKNIETKPTVVSPMGGESINTLFKIQWSFPSTDLANTQFEVSLSANNGQSWKILFLSNKGELSRDFDFTNEPESTQSLIRVRALFNGYYSEPTQSNVFTIQHNVAPTSPTNLYPNGGVAIGRSSIQRLSWKFNDPNVNDQQSKFDLNWRLQGSPTWNTVSIVSNNQYWDAPNNTFPLGSIEWQVRTYDQYGLVSPYSSIEIFNVADKPDKPIFTSPLDGDVVTVSNPMISWSSFDQKSFHIKVFSVANILLWENTYTSTNKTITLEYNLKNLESYRIEIAIQTSNGLWSDFAIANIAVSYTQPLPPKLILTSDMNRACVLISLDYPPLSEEYPNVILSNVYRKKFNEDDWTLIFSSADTDFTDYECPFGLYEYSVIAVGDNETFSERSVTQSVDMMFDGWWIVDQEDKDTFQFLYNVPSIQVNVEEERFEFKTFSSKPFIRYGAFQAERGSLSGWVIEENNLTPREQSLHLFKLINKRKPLVLKNHFGDYWTVNVYNPTRNLNPINYEEISVEWVEV